MSDEIQYWQIIESIEVEEVFGVHDGKTLMVNQTVRPEDVESKFIGVGPALAIPFLADYSGVAVGVEAESLSG
jgi:hypothetical protein